MTKLKVAELVFDMTVYPRHDVDAHHVNDIARAMEAGAEMPPIVIEKKSRRIIDGFHRGKAYQKLYEPETEIDVIEKTYRDEQALFLDAIRYNSSHGKNFDSHDRAHCTIMALNLGIDDKALAGVLHVDEDYIGKLRADRVAFGGKIEPSIVGGGKTNRLQVPIKQTIKHMAGKTLTNDQQAANNKLSGMNQSFYANQLITLIESKLIDLADERLMERLRILHEMLDDLLVAGRG